MAWLLLCFSSGRWHSQPLNVVLRVFKNHPFDLRSYTCAILERVMYNGDVIELKGSSSYYSCNMKWKRICDTHPEAEVVLRDPIDDNLFQPCPLTRSSFRFRVTFREVVSMLQRVIAEWWSFLLFWRVPPSVSLLTGPLIKPINLLNISFMERYRLAFGHETGCPSFVLEEAWRRDVYYDDVGMLKEEMIVEGIGQWSINEWMNVEVMKRDEKEGVQFTTVEWRGKKYLWSNNVD